MAAKARKWTADHKQRTTRRFEVHFFPWLGHKDIGDVSDDDILPCLRRMEDRNLLDTAHRARSENDSLFRYAKKRKLVKHNVIADLRGTDTLSRPKVKHHAAITDPTQLAPLLRAIDAYHGGFVVRQALRFLPLAFVRPGELQWATWSEFDLEGAEWRIPGPRMKMREQHIVPLSRPLSDSHEVQPSSIVSAEHINQSWRVHLNHLLQGGIAPPNWHRGRQIATHRSPVGRSMPTPASRIHYTPGLSYHSSPAQVRHQPRDRQHRGRGTAPARELPERPPTTRRPHTLRVG